LIGRLRHESGDQAVVLAVMSSSFAAPTWAPRRGGPGLGVPETCAVPGSRRYPPKRAGALLRRPVCVVLTLYGIAAEFFGLDAVGPGRLVAAGLVAAGSRGVAPVCRWWRPMCAVVTLYGIAAELLGLDAAGPGRLADRLVPAGSRGA
jgi:hypothetical protein